MAASNLNCSPKLVMIIEPESRFRFRYESEPGSHGGICGKRTSDGKKTHPTIKLENYFEEKPVYIRVKLLTINKEEHVLEIKGKNAKNGMYYEDLDTDFTAKFTNLCIMSKKKEEVYQALMERKLKSLGYVNNGSVRKQFENRYKAEVKNHAKDIYNSGILCFEAFLKNNHAELICPPLYSDPIYNQKCAQKGDLKIHRISHWAGSWKGGDTIILLCDKVQKENIKVLFCDPEDNWEAYGEFSKVDVHYQVAITFKTPKYKENIEKTVNICLVRGDEMSDTVEYKYIPDDCDLLGPSRKRKKHLFEGSVYSPEEMPENFLSPSSSNGNSSDNHIEEIFVPGHSNMNAQHAPPFDLMKYISENEQGPFPLESSEDSLTSNREEIPESLQNEGNACSSNEDIMKPTEDIMMILNSLGGEMSSDLEFGVDELCLLNYDKLIECCAIGGNQSGNYYNTDGIVSSLLKDLDHRSEQRAVGQMMTELQIDDYRSKPVVSKYNENGDKKNKRIDIHSSKSKENYSKYLSMKDNCGNTLLHLAVFHNKNVERVLKWIRSIHYDMNVKNNQNKTALHIATEKNNIQAVKLLLRHGGNPCIMDSNGNNCLHIASENNFHKCLAELSHYVDRDGVNTFNYEGLTPLHILVSKNYPECFHAIQHKVDVNVLEKKSGKSPLHIAVIVESSLIFDLLEKSDIDVNIQDFGGNTPLHLASVAGNTSYVKWLLKVGADTQIRNFKQSDEGSENETIVGQTPLDIATDLEVIEILKKEIAESSAIDSQRQCFKDALQVLDPLTEEKLCQLLDPEEWKKVVMYMGVDECFLNSIKCSSSPTRTILNLLKKENEDGYINELENIFEISELTNALKILRERKH